MLIFLQMIESDEDKSKFEEIYKEYRRLMFYVAYKRLGHEQDAEDVVSHVFVKIAEKIKNIEPVCPKTRNLIVTMVDNRVTDIFRARGRHPVAAYDDELLDGSVEMPCEDDVLEQCILRLPSRLRMLIWMKYYQGYSLKEIAEMQGLSLAAVQKADYRARQKLKEIYEEEVSLI